MTRFKKVFKRVLAVFLVMTTVCTEISVIETNAVVTSCDSYEGSNIEAQDYSRWASVVDSYLTVTDDGTMMRVQNTTNNGVLVEYYDDEYNILSSRLLGSELSIFGGFYESDNNYFLVTGQTNKEQSADVEVVRITKYDKDWNRISSTGLYDCNTTVPFDAGSCRMDMLGKYLMIRTSHEMYASDDGYNHQANMTIQVDTNTMTITDSYYGVMNTGWGYASHSFNQFIKMDGNNIIAVDHGDAYPRSIALFKYKTDASTGSFTPDYYTQCDVIDVLTIPGAIGENATNATVGGFEISDSSYLVAGNSVVQDSSNLSRTTRNVYVAAVNKSTNAVTMNWITSYAEGDGTTSTPHMVKLSQNKYVVLWFRDNVVYYTLIDGSGNKTGNIYSINGNLSDCVPVVLNNKLVWYTWKDGQIVFYDIDLNDLSHTNVTEINNGHHYSNSGVADGVAALVCSKCGTTTLLDVPTSMSVWWNQNGGSGYYYSMFNSPTKVGDKMYCWVTVSSETSESVDDEIEIFVDDPSVISVEKTSDTNAILVMKSAGTTRITVRPRWNTNLAGTYSITVESDVQVEINGFQISSVAEGFRTVYSVSDSGNEVVSAGLVYGLTDYATAVDMVVGSNNGYVYDFKATSAGKLSESFSELDSAASYAMTMKFGSCSPKFFEASTMVRAYAKLADGSYIYSDVVTCRVYDIADVLYNNNWMNTEDSHTYLYTNILSKVNTGYNKVEFVSGNSLVTP